MAATPFIPTRQFLARPIASAGFSDEFVHYCKSRTWVRLGDILQHSLAALLDNHGYLTYCHDELVGYLRSHHRLYLFDLPKTIGAHELND